MEKRVWANMVGANMELPAKSIIASNFVFILCPAFLPGNKA
jgi:hypothetical protein